MFVVLRSDIYKISVRDSRVFCEFVLMGKYVTCMYSTGFK